jgi:hypothetical protein
MKKIVLIVLCFYSSLTFAQKTEGELIKVTAAAETKVKDTTNIGWKKGGTFTFLFNQSAFNNNWLGGGVSSIAGNIALNYDFNYKKGRAIWDNKIIAAYGLTKQKDVVQTKTDDRLEYTSLYGYKANGNWFYTFFFNFKTQMDSGFDVVTQKRISHFFSPAYFQSGPGLLWKKSENLKLNFAPATSRLILVNEFLTKNGSSFGVEQGNTSRFEFGAAVNAYYKFNVVENVSMENILNLYSNYLDQPQNVDIDYQMNLVMKINKYMTANVAFQAIYDDNAIKAVQVRQVFGLGFNYGF